MRPQALGAVTLLFSLWSAAHASARPQANVAWATGVCGSGDRNTVWRDTRWCNGLRADWLLGRERGSDWALGPYAQIMTAGFWDARFAAGVSALAPLMDDFPLVLSLGAGAHELRAAQAEAWLFWGPRAYNFHASYSLAGGVLLGFSRDLDQDAQTSLYLGMQIDGLVLALPFILAYEWARGSPR
jgi:hypothetical protein